MLYKDWPAVVILKSTSLFGAVLKASQYQRRAMTAKISKSINAT